MNYFAPGRQTLETGEPDLCGLRGELTPGWLRTPATDSGASKRRGPTEPTCRPTCLGQRREDLTDNYGTIFRDSLRENRPDIYRKLQESGELEGLVEETRQRARAMHEQVVSQQLQNPPQRGESPEDQRKYAEQVAREMVLDEILVQSPEDEE